MDFPTRIPRWLTVVCLALAVALVLPVTPGIAQDGDAPDGADEAPVGFTVGEPVVFRNLAIFPLLARNGADGTEYLTLDEGVEAGLVTVEELGGNGPAQMRMNRNNAIEPNAPNPAPQNEAQAQDEAQPQDEPQRQETDPQAPDGEPEAGQAGPYEGLRRMVERLQNDGDPRWLDEVILEVVRIQRQRIEAERMRLMPQGRDIRPDLDRLALEEARLDAIEEAVRNGAAQQNRLPDDLRQRVEEEMQQQEQTQELQPQAQQAVPQQQMRSGAAVNRLRVTNNSDSPLFLMAGELVLGGQQDRIVAVDTIVPAGEAMEIQVFCVEQGRWHGEVRFGSGNAVVHNGLRAVAQDSKSQRAVWDEVARANGKFGTAAGNDTGTYRHNLTNEQITEQTAAYVGHFQQHFQIGDRMIGCAVAIRGEVVVMDRFGAPGVFRALWPKLLKSHVLAAILEAADWKEAHADDEDFDPEAPVAAPTADAVLAFYRDAVAARTEADDNGQARVHAQRLETDNVTGFIARAAGDDAEADADDAELLHENLYKKQ